ncbi:Protein PHYTOCHROME-DEPENDENT LATE-FLOWERING, partial [Cucurbita argyrosperma subsp. sororia]
MGVSFKISVKGKRFRSTPCITRSRSTAVDDDEFKDESRVLSKNKSSLARKLDSEETERSGDVNGVTGSSLHHLIPENGVSFTLNLFRDGYSIGKPSEVSLKIALLHLSGK